MLRHEYNLRFELRQALPKNAEVVLIDLPGSRGRLIGRMRPSDFRQIPKIWHRSTVPLFHRIAAARIMSHQASIILATDRHVGFWNDIAALCPDVRQILVGHGVLAPFLRERLRRTTSLPNRLLCVWSRRQREVVSRFSGSGLRVIELGSVRNACYQDAKTRGDFSSIPHRADVICVISSFSGADKERKRAELGDPRGAMRAQLLLTASKLAHESGLPIHIALKPETMWHFSTARSTRFDSERQYFSDALDGIPLTFSNPESRFETYRLVDAALVTLGIFSSPIVEGFGRFQNVYSVGPVSTREEYGSLPDYAHIDGSESLNSSSILKRALDIRNDSSIVKSEGEERSFYLKDGLSAQPIQTLRDLLSGA